MNLYAAPMEGLTGYIYRNAHHAFFNHIDKYFSPFILANQHAALKSRELNDIMPQHNKDLVLIPQILTNNARDFIRTSELVRDMGYGEVNLNLGCPSGTVVSKNKGAGFLAKPAELDAFLEEIFTASITKISVKTRIGMSEPEEFYGLMEIYNRYPMTELIIHPRIREDYYKNKPNMAVFKDALAMSRNPVCYNGDIFTKQAYEAFAREFPHVGSVMLGRGLLADPNLAGDIKSGVKVDLHQLKAFHDRIYEDYRGVLSGDRNILFKMRELWHYMLPTCPNHEKYAKKIKKAQHLWDYEAAVSDLFGN